MRKAKSRSQKIRELIERGFTTRYIVEKMNVKPQIVYNLRYELNKQRGLGALPRRKVRAGTGIAVPDVVTINLAPAAPAAPPEKPSVFARVKGALLRMVGMVA